MPSRKVDTSVFAAVGRNPTTHESQCQANASASANASRAVVDPFFMLILLRAAKKRPNPRSGRQ
ncbi:MAG: hypothetical protein V2A73_19340 [Pseudomonadota bacterium]